MKSLCVIVCGLMLIGLASAQSWSISNPRLATILMGVSCTDINTCWISGDGNAGNTIMYTSNAAVDWYAQNVGFDAIFMFCTAMGNATSGVSTGLGLSLAEGSAYTTDGKNWTEATTKNLFGAFQDCGALSTTNYYKIGQWSVATDLNGDGVMFSTNGGVSYLGKDWGQATDARYGSFINTTTGYIAGGMWPETSSANAFLAAQGNVQRRVSQRYALVDGKLVEIPHEALFGRVHRRGGYVSKAAPPPTNYVGVIAKTTDGGNTWKVVASNNATLSWYYNGINCVDANNCWAVAEGQNSTNGLPCAYIFHTSNGGANWNQQLYVEYGSLIQIKFLNANEGWAVGGDKNPNSKGAGTFWHTTNGGQTWTLASSINDCYIFDLSLVDSTHAFAVGAQGKLASVFKYA